ncbi:MAG: M36 family metallopeptidase [Acidobacteriota bacterium]
MRRLLAFAAICVFAVLLVDMAPSPVAEVSAERFVSGDSASRLSNYDVRELDPAELNEVIRMTGHEENADVSKRLLKRIRKAVNAFPIRNPSGTIELNKTTGVAETITAAAERGANLEGFASERGITLRRFVAKNQELFGDVSSDALFDGYDYANPDGVLAFAAIEQRIHDIPVFQGEIKGAFNKKGELLRVINNLAPTGDAAVSTDFGSAEDALAAAYLHLGIDSADGKIVFEHGGSADDPTAERVYFPIRPGTLLPAWKALTWLDSGAYYVIVEARTGALLWRKSITEDQAVPATYNVYGTATGMMNTADSPSPFTPGCITPIACAQPPLIARTSYSLVGNEAPNQFNNLGWIPDAGLPVRTPADPNITDGNNAEAGIDRDGTQGVDPNGWAFGNPTRVFSYNYNPAPGNPAPGDEPVPPGPQPYPPTQFQQGVISHAFYTVNRFHDTAYRLGFTEQAGNFQHFNFGRGGAEGDRISFEIQDSSGTNGANFSAPADGGRGRLQISVWTGPTPDRDGALDTQMVVHELSHGVSNRLHGNSTGLSSNMARGLGEGWGDFFALAMLSEPTDIRLGTYSIGGYSTYLAAPGYDSNYYYGLRRFPTALWDATGGGGCRHDPFTFADVDATQFDISNSCFPRGLVGSTTADQVHNIGEVWNAILWEVRDKLIQAHGPAEGNRRALQYVMDGMKISPINPTMVQSRDAVIFAAQASDAKDVAPIWAGFAVRGLGFGAAVINAGTGTNNTRVAESFGTPNVTVTEPFSVSDSVGNNNGYPEMGENLLITVTLTNTTGLAVNNVSASIQNGGTAFYGTIASGQTVSRQIPYFLPVYGTCDNRHTITINVSSAAGSFSTTRQFRFGPPAPMFTNSAPITINDNAPASAYPSVMNVSGVVFGGRVSVELIGFSHIFPNDVDIMLQGPGGQSFVVMSDVGGTTGAAPINFTLTDLAANSISDSSRIAAGEYRPTNVGAGDVFAAPAPSNPASPAPAGIASFASVFSGAQVNGDWKLYIVDDTGGDGGTISGGWKLTVDPIICIDVFPSRVRDDFDGDRKTDVSVFRPSDSNWYIDRSSAGFAAVNWGLPTDSLVPDDYDGDGKADIAVFRPSADGSLADFYIIRSSNSTFSFISWGLPGDIPAVDDFDRDNKADVGIFRPSTRTFWILRSSNGTIFGSRPIPPGRTLTGDFDGDGGADLVSYSGGQWFVLNSSTNYQSGTTFPWGLESDKVVAADYDGDGVVDAAVYRPSDGTWYVRKSSGGSSYIRFGIASDVPVPGDYDGDGKADAAVFRDGVWYVNGSAAGLIVKHFGLSSDKPLPAEFVR